MRNPHPFPSESADPFESSEEIMSFRGVLNTLKDRALLVVGAIVLTGVLLVAAACLVVGLQPSVTQATVVARLTFAGVDKGKYPNGTAFSPSDLVDTPVMQKVYEQNRLERQISFADFKEAFIVTNQNPAIERVQREYRALLDNRQLSVADRQKLEAEFESKAKSVMNGEYTVSVASSDRFFTSSPTLVAKLLEDVLEVWARLSESKGIYLYDIELYSPNIIRLQSLAKDDYMMVYDQLRVSIDRILDNLDKLSKLPGANLVKAGEEGTTVADLRAHLNDILKFRLPAISGMIRQGGLSREREVSSIYINEQLFRLNMEVEALTKRRDMYVRALKDYNTKDGQPSEVVGMPDSVRGGGNAMTMGTTIPQFGESFLNRIVELANQNSDLAFRQEMSRQSLLLGGQLVETEREKAVYADMLKGIAEAEQTVEATKRQSMQAFIDTRIQSLVSEVQAALALSQDFHRRLSAENLKPSKVYSITTPLTLVKMPAFITVKKLAVAAFGLWLVVSAGVIVLAVFMGRRQRAHAAEAETYVQVPTAPKFGAVNEG